MAQDERVKALMAAFQKTAYFKWMARQGIPVVDGYGVEDVRDIAMASWARMGGNAAFVNLYGMEGVTGMYVSWKAKAPLKFGKTAVASRCLSGVRGVFSRRRSIPGIACSTAVARR